MPFTGAVGRLGQCTALTTLNLRECGSLTCLPDLSGVPGLKELYQYGDPEEGQIGVRDLPAGLAEGAWHTRMHARTQHQPL